MVVRTYFLFTGVLFNLVPSTPHQLTQSCRAIDPVFEYAKIGPFLPANSVLPNVCTYSRQADDKQSPQEAAGDMYVVVVASVRCK